eukprot:TRINITY_DN18707_c0_g1_i1.p1 TRINITY_DN18707_c0_g1~~TRINITY_DN18707_c0_g1_i1.p1  ORF type:complete len:412 (-),score=43.98 TRINITY_DN18707_c0_g1_i1:322-1557(-)
MGATLTAEAVTTCGPLAAGAVVGSVCTSSWDRCSDRVCHCQQGRNCRCTKDHLNLCAFDNGQILTVDGVVHEAEIPRGVLGFFTDNEPVIGVRARTLPFAQAIGQRPAEAAQFWPSLPTRALWGPNCDSGNDSACESDPGVAPTGLDAAVAPFSSTLRSPLMKPLQRNTGASKGGCESGANSARGNDTRPSNQILGEGLVFDRYSFFDYPFIMPGLTIHDDLVIAFGVRTVLRIPALGVANAPLDFDVLGSVQVPVRKLLETTSPVEVCIPIIPRGESLRQVACVSLSVGATEMVVATSYGTDGAPPADAMNTWSSRSLEKPTGCKQERIIFDKDMSDLMHCGNVVEHSMHALEDHMLRLQRRPQNAPPWLSLATLAEESESRENDAVGASATGDSQRKPTAQLCTPAVAG